MRHGPVRDAKHQYAKADHHLLVLAMTAPIDAPLDKTWDGSVQDDQGRQQD